MYALLALAFALYHPTPASAQQWTTNGNNINSANTGNVGVNTSAPEARFSVSNKLRLFDSTPPGSGSDAGYLFGATIPSGLVTEASGELLTYGINVPQLGTRSTARVGGLFRLDTRAAEQRFVLYAYPSGGSVATDRFSVNLQNGNVFMAANGGNVGIGTAAPTSKMHLVSGTDSGTSLLHLDTGVHGGTAFTVFGNANNESSIDISVFRAGAYASRFGVGNLGQVYLQPGGGNVGVGTSTPGAPLEVKSNTGGATLLKLYDSSTSGTASAPKVMFNAGGTDIANIQANYNSGAFRLDFGATSTARALSILNSGNVGVGTTSPGYRLDVQGGQLNASGGLCINGVCKASWSEVGGTSQWTTGGSGIHYASGNVGIGTAPTTSKLHVAGNVTVEGNLAAKYQDVAEWVPSKQRLVAGTVVVLDTERPNHVVASTAQYDTRVAGVVSEQPGLILGEGGEGKLMVATTGRVRVKVDATRAPVRVGDLLVTSDVAGVAMRSLPLDLGGTQIHRPGTIIGKALEPLEKGSGEILVLLSLQ